MRKIILSIFLLLAIIPTNIISSSSLFSKSKEGVTNYAKTLNIYFIENEVFTVSTDNNAFDIHVDNYEDATDVYVMMDQKDPDCVISLNGVCNNGRLCIEADTCYTLRLNNVQLKSSHAPAINSVTKQKVNLELADGSQNILSDSKDYIFTNLNEQASACLNIQGSLNVSGSGTLLIKGNSKHGIATGKGMKFQSGDIRVLSAPSDAIHADGSIQIDGADLIINGQKQDGLDAGKDVKISNGTVSITSTKKDVKAIKCGSAFSMSGGFLDMKIEGDASKGIKAKENISISGGEITATANGNVIISKGDPSYCTIIKGDSCVFISGGRLSLINKGAGGKCISTDKNIYINDGDIYLETHGNGNEYINDTNETDYYTSKCITADDSLFIHRGNLKCLSTGIGGKGIVAERYLEIGHPSDTNYHLGPRITIDTTNSSIVNDVEEDERYGCPKAIKASEYLNIFSGDIQITTAGMGGEGVECGKEMYIYGGNLECNCFDDGINVGEKLEILGGQVYCNSIDNDGIDSNGSIYIKGGIVASVNQMIPNESFDTENHQFFIQGGIIIGIGSNPVNMDNEECLYYNTLYNNDPERPIRRGLRLTPGKYVYVMDEDSNILISLLNDNQNRRGFITVASPDFSQEKKYSILQGEKPTDPISHFFNERLLIGGFPLNEEHIVDFYPKYNFND